MLLLWGPFQQSTHQVFFMLHKIIVCCLVVVALAFPARASSLWHPEPGFLPEDARHAVPNNPLRRNARFPNRFFRLFRFKMKAPYAAWPPRKKWRP